MKSIRTPLSQQDIDLFKTFLDRIGLNEVITGDYKGKGQERYICYAYSEKSSKVIAILTHILLNTVTCIVHFTII